MQNYQFAEWVIRGIGGIVNMLAAYIQEGGTITDDQKQRLSDYADKLDACFVKLSR